MLKNKIIVVTGGAGLLGQVFVRGIAQHGGIAVLADIKDYSKKPDQKSLDKDVSGSIEVASLDITNKDSVIDLISNLMVKYGRIDAVVNNAYPRNKNYGRKLEDVSYEDFCEDINTHLGGYFLVAQQFCKVFKKQGYGNIINISSIYGVMAPRFEVYDGTSMTSPVEYAASKSAIIQLTRYFAKYFKVHGIRVNCISPGGVFDYQPESFLKNYKTHCATKGMLDPQDILGTLIFLLSDQSTFMTGQNLILDDGFTL